MGIAPVSLTLYSPGWYNRFRMSEVITGVSPIPTETFLLEIGVEELPAGSVAPALHQFLTALLARLDEDRLGADSAHARTYATPRRLTVVVPGVGLRQPDAEVVVRGPNVKAAFGPDGAPTPAAQGFARKNNVAVDALQVEGENLVARRVEPGKPAAEVLAQAIPELLRTITFGKFMRWGEGNYRFGRPLRRFLALLGSEVVSFEVEGVGSGRETVGHRFLAPDVLSLSRPEEYAERLRAVFVEPDPEVRREQIVAQATALAEAVDGTAVLPPSLISENVYLTEWVTAICGGFSAEYLSLPRPVLETAMQKHQRFFPVEGKDGNLLSYFIAIRSGNADHQDTVRLGYEGVLGSRFNDAKFFFDHDRETPLSAKTERLHRIVFQEKLGTLADKGERLRALLDSTGMADWTGEAENARRAVTLAKADLASETVMELPSLQGVMGREFALLDAEPEPVAVALFEQYLPRTSEDKLPDSRIGTALSLLDRVDTLVGYMRFVGAEPKGSSDPFGLKRAASAIVDLLARDRTLPALSTLIDAAQAGYEAQGLHAHEKPGNLWALVEARLRGVLEERGIRYDVLDAVLNAPWDHIASVVARADAVAAMVASGKTGAAIAATRPRNILRTAKDPIPDTPDTALLTADSEKDLIAALRETEPRVNDAIASGDFTTALAALESLAVPIGTLFDAVMIMDPDPAIRAARLGLLAQADRLFLRIADFSRLVME
ncbi:MAG: glycine--tRNA ligase subunit beta [Armatimonadaceae bacterium]